MARGPRIAFSQPAAAPVRKIAHRAAQSHEQADQGITPPRRAESQSHARPAPAGEALDAGISTWTAPSAPAKRDEPAQGTPARHSHREKAP